MNHPLRSLSLLAIAAGVFAADGPTQQPVMSALKDNDLKITIGGQMQARADMSKAQTSTDTYDIATGTANARSDDLDFYMRRVRLFVNGSYGDYSFNLGLRADNADRKDNSTTTANNQRGFEIHNASVTRTFKGTISHAIQIGLDYPFFNSASMGNSSAQLTAADRASLQLLAPRGTGIGYRLNTPNITFGADLQKNTKVLAGDGDTATPATGTQYQAQGLCYTARIELTPSNDWQTKGKVKESYAGASGHHWMAALETGYNQHDVITTGVNNPQNDSNGHNEAARWLDTWTIGAETLVHIDGLTAMAEYRWTRQTANTDNGEPKSSTTWSNPVYANVFLLQAGYALPCPMINGAVVEPIARYSYINLDHDNPNEAGNYGSADYASASGNQYELGVNWYLNGAGQYSNKVSVLYQHWLAEDTGTNGTAQPKADIVRVQYQFLF